MRQRQISPSFWRDERVWDLSSDSVRLLIPGLWQLADREGRLPDKPFDLGVEARPWAPREVAAMIDELVEVGLLLRYEVDGLRCLAFPPAAWARHQRPHPNERASQLPGPPGNSLEGTPIGAPRSSTRSTKVILTQSGSSEPSGSSGSSSPPSLLPPSPPMPMPRHCPPPEAVPEGGQEHDRREALIRDAEAFLAWAQVARAHLGATDPPGRRAREWAAHFFAKYEPTSVEPLKAAFEDFLAWCRSTSPPRAPGWGLWIQPAVWEERWAAARVAAGAGVRPPKERRA